MQGNWQQMIFLKFVICPPHREFLPIFRRPQQNGFLNQHLCWDQHLVFSRSTLYKLIYIQIIQKHTFKKTLGVLYNLVQSTQLYGCSRQCGCPVGARCSIGFGPNPLINGLIQHTFKFNIFFLEKFKVIHCD